MAGGQPWASPPCPQAGPGRHQPAPRPVLGATSPPPDRCWASPASPQAAPGRHLPAPRPELGVATLPPGRCWASPPRPQIPPGRRHLTPRPVLGVATPSQDSSWASALWPQAGLGVATLPAVSFLASTLRPKAARCGLMCFQIFAFSADKGLTFSRTVYRFNCATVATPPAGPCPHCGSASRVLLPRPLACYLLAERPCILESNATQAASYAASTHPHP